MTSEIDTAVADMLSMPVPSWPKALPVTERPLSLGEIGEQGWNALTGDLPLPVMVLKETALDHNISLMSEFCADQGLDLAPHGKTTMSPQIVLRQLDAGAWGVTAATATQARIFHEFGVKRIIIANQLLDPAGVRWAAAALRADPALSLTCLVDSVAGVRRLTELLGGAASMPVLLELGVQGQRTGCRSSQDVRAVVEAVDRSPALHLVGIETFEGVIGADHDPATVEEVDQHLTWVRDVAERLMQENAFAVDEEVVVTAGGSIYPDRVAAVLGAAWDPPQSTRRVLRSGCYVTHDHGLYEEGSPFGRHATGVRLQPALEVWGVVLSHPESDLAIVGFGRRDVPYDAGLPIPFGIRSGGDHGRPTSEVQVVQLNDQHAFVRDLGGELQVGDLLGCGISHPCTAFDKWGLIPVVNDDYAVTAAVRTYF